MLARAILVLAVILGVAATAPADVVTTTDGSRIVGTLERMGPDGAVIVTDFAGKLTIPADKVAAVTTDQKVNIAFSSGDRLIGNLAESPDGNRVVVQSEIGDVPVEREKMTAVWPEGADSPEVVALKVEQEKKLAAVTPKWTAVLEAGGSRTEGNTDTLDARGRFDVKRKTDVDLLSFYLYGNYSETDKTRTKNEYGGGVRFEAKIRNDLFWYTRLGLEHDEFERLDIRAEVAAGLAQYWVNKPEAELKTSLGVGYRHETYDTGKTSNDAFLDLGLDYRRDLAPWVQFTHATTYSPGFSDFGDYRLNVDNALVFPFERDDLKLKVGMRNEYNSRPPRGNDRLDNTYYANIVLTLK